MARTNISVHSDGSIEEHTNCFPSALRMTSGGTPLNWRRGVIDPHLLFSETCLCRIEKNNSHSFLNHLTEVESRLRRHSPAALEADFEHGPDNPGQPSMRNAQEQWQVKKLTVQLTAEQTPYRQRERILRPFIR